VNSLTSDEEHFYLIWIVNVKFLDSVGD
jgi:hypothetical protein